PMGRSSAPERRSSCTSARPGRSGEAGERGGPAVRKLLQDEREIRVARQHWSVFISVVGGCLLVVAVIAGLGRVLPSHVSSVSIDSAKTFVLVLAIAGAAAVLTTRWLRWRYTTFTLTDRRADRSRRATPRRGPPDTDRPRGTDRPRDRTGSRGRRRGRWRPPSPCPVYGCGVGVGVGFGFGLLCLGFGFPLVLPVVCRCVP